MANSIRAWNNDLKANSSSPISDHRKVCLWRDSDLRNVRYPVVMGWQADLEEAVLNKLALRVRPLTKGPDGAPVNKLPTPHFEFPASSNDPPRGDLAVRRVAPSPRRLDAAPLDAVPLGQLADRIVAFLREWREDLQALLLWRERNRHALREFWARAPDALGVKRELEKALAPGGKPTK